MDAKRGIPPALEYFQDCCTRCDTDLQNSSFYQLYRPIDNAIRALHDDTAE